MKKVYFILISLILTALLAVSTVAANVISAIADDYNPGYLPEYSIDGDESKFWHTEWQGGTNPLPISIFFELDGTYNLEGVTILPRLDGNFNGLIYTFNVYVSVDGVNYTLAAANCEFEYTEEAQTATFTAVPAKFIQIEALDTEGGFVSINEFTVTASEIIAAEPETQSAPVVVDEPAVIDTPAAEVPAAVTQPAAPQTDDISFMLFAAMSLSAAAASAIKKFRK